MYFQVIKMLLFIVSIFHVCWGPRLIMNVVIAMGLTHYDQYTYSARVACYLLSFIHSALNPFVYGFMSSNFRRMMLQSCNNNTTQGQPNGSLIELAATSSCINMSQFNVGSGNRRKTTDFHECSLKNDIILTTDINIISEDKRSATSDCGRYHYSDNNTLSQLTSHSF